MAGREHPFIPEFHSEDEEREFWEQVDVAKFIECPADKIVLELRPKRRRRKKVTSEVSEDESRLLLAIKLYELGCLSLGQSAKLAGYSKRAFIELLEKYGVPVIAYSPKELREEVHE
jgi:predicted HTH domain antitoxin